MPFDPEPDDDASGYGTPLPPEDRLWRHPSELGPHGPGGSRRSMEPMEIGWPPLPLSELPAGEPTASSHRRGAMATVVVVSCLAGAVVALGVTMATRPRTIIERPVAQLTTPAPRATVAFGPAVQVEDVATELGPSMARLDVRRSGTWVTGAGVIVDDKGTVLTTSDLLAAGGQIIVTFDDGRARSASVVGVDALTGLAAVRTTATGRRAVPFASARAQVGQSVVLVGGPTTSAIRTSRSTVSTAVIRASGRRVVEPSGVLHDMFEIDRDVLPDSAGGVLADREGNVLGIAVSDGHGDGVGYVVPGDVAQQVVRSLTIDGRVHRSLLGVQAVDLEPLAAESLGLAGGARLTEVSEGGPAAAGGLQVGDVIVSIDGRAVGSASDVVVALRELPPGHTTPIVAWRGDHRLQLSATLGRS